MNEAPPQPTPSPTPRFGGLPGLVIEMGPGFNEELADFVEWERVAMVDPKWEDPLD